LSSTTIMADDDSLFILATTSHFATWLTLNGTLKMVKSICS